MHLLTRDHPEATAKANDLKITVEDARQRRFEYGFQAIGFRLIDERHLPVIIAGWLGGRALRDAGSAKKPKVSFETTSILLDASEKPGPTFGLTAKAGAGTSSPLGFGNRGADGLFSAPFAKTVTVDPSSTDVKLVFKLSNAANFKPPTPAPPAPAPAVTVDETKFRDVMILATLKLGTNPA